MTILEWQIWIANQGGLSSTPKADIQAILKDWEAQLAEKDREIAEEIEASGNLLKEAIDANDYQRRHRKWALKRARYWATWLRKGLEVAKGYITDFRAAFHSHIVDAVFILGEHAEQAEADRDRWKTEAATSRRLSLEAEEDEADALADRDRWKARAETAQRKLRLPYRCPVCNGMGSVNRESTETTATNKIPCHACSGLRLIWSYTALEDEG